MPSKRTRNIISMLFSVVAIMSIGATALIFSACDAPTPEVDEKIYYYTVESFDELKLALADEVGDGEKQISISSNIEFPETLSIDEKITISSSANVTLTRAIELEGSYFLVEESGAFTLQSQNQIVFDGGEVLKGAPAISNQGFLILGENIEFKNFIGNQRGVVVNSVGTLEIDGAIIHDNKLDENAGSVYGIVYNNTGSTFNFKDGKIYNNSTHTPGVIFVNEKVNAKFIGGEIYSNVCTGNGIIYIKSATVEFDHCKIHNNKTKNGVIFFNNEANGLIDGTEIYENEATINGGAIYLNESAKVVINSVKMIGNKSTGAGGAIYHYSSNQLIVNDCEISNNYAGSYGGIAYLNGAGSFVLNGGTLENNISHNSGGGIFVNATSTANSTFIMNGGLLKGNKTEANNSNGGAIINKSFTIINGGTISDNETENLGGAIRSYADTNKNAKLTINGGLFEHNRNRGYGAFGGAIHCTTLLEITGGEFVLNHSKSNGGAIYWGTGCTGTISGATFKDNTTATNGGAIYFVTNCQAEVKNCVFEDNYAANGGALAAFSKNLTISQSNFNQNNANNGGAIYFFDAVNAEMYNNNFDDNLAITNAGGAIYTLAESLKIYGGHFVGNIASKAGGGIYTRHKDIQITETEFSSNQSNSTKTDAGGGGGIAAFGDGTTELNLILNNTKFDANTSTYRGPDIYVYSENKSVTPVVTINNGAFSHIGVQYATLKIGGDIKIADKLEFHATKQDNYAYLEIIKEVTNPFSINSISGSYTEEQASKAQLVRYTANDPWSNIYSQARKINLLEQLASDGGTKAGYGFQVVDGKILMHKENKKIGISANVVAIDAPLDSKASETVSFKALEEYSISNVKVVNNSTNEEVTLQEAAGSYSFTMPDSDVTISYDVTSSLPLTVAQNVKDFIQVDSTYAFMQDVNVALVNQFEQKVVKLYVELDNGTQIDLLKTPTFKMFKGATILGEISPYYEVSFQQDEKVESLNFIQTNCTEDGKAYASEGETVQFSIDFNSEPSYNRYIITEVYYELDNIKTVITQENGMYKFVMPNNNVEIKFTFGDILENIDGGVVVANEEQLLEAIQQSNTIVIKGEIVLTNTIYLNEGTFEIIGTGNAKLIRGEQLKGAFFDVDSKATLILGTDKIEDCALVLDGNGEKVEDISNAILVCRNGGVLNIFDGISICNNILKTENELFSDAGMGYGTLYSVAHAGGAGILNFFGQVNIYGGEIDNNHTLGNIHGAGIFNYGTLNMFSGSIRNNSTVNGNGAGIFNAKSLTLNGGSIQNNEILGDGYGAGIYMSGSKYSHTFIYAGEIKENSSPRSGAGLFVSSLGSCFIHGGTFEGNQSTKYNGGAINSRGNLYIYGGTFSNNTAVGNGGAIYQYVTESAIFGGKFENNSAANGGAICYAQGAVARILGGEFVGNEAYKRGGAICLLGEKNSDTPTTLTITGGTFEANTCEQGNAVAVEYAILELGGTPAIDGTISIVAQTTNQSAFIRFISNFNAGTKFKISPYSYADLAELGKLLQVQTNVNVEDLLENIVLENADYKVEIENGQLVIKKVNSETSRGEL